MILELTSTERRLLLRGLLTCRSGMEPGIMQADIDNLAERLMDLRLDGSPSPSAPGATGVTGAGVASPSPSSGSTAQPLSSNAVAGRATGSGADTSGPALPEVRWASNAKEVDKRDAEVLVLVLSKVERKDLQKDDKSIPRLSVSWQRQGRGYAYASVWDEALFPWVANRVRQKTKFYLQHKGEYLNIIGVEA